MSRIFFTHRRRALAVSAVLVLSLERPAEKMFENLLAGVGQKQQNRWLLHNLWKILDGKKTVDKLGRIFLSFFFFNFWSDQIDIFRNKDLGTDGKGQHLCHNDKEHAS